VGTHCGVEEIKTRREGAIEVVEALGEVDMSNVEMLNGALKIALSDETTSCLLDLSGLDFLDSTVIKALVRWSNDAQLSDREALAIVVGEETPAARLVALLGLTGRLPLFRTRDAARTALLEGQRARAQRNLEWLTDAELSEARSDAEAASGAAIRRLDDITQEEDRRPDGPHDRSD
jgi:anti-anti-sigma factor